MKHSAFGIGVIVMALVAFLAGRATAPHASLVLSDGGTLKNARLYNVPLMVVGNDIVFENNSFVGEGRIILGHRQRDEIGPGYPMSR